MSYQSGDMYNGVMLTGKAYKKKGESYVEFICTCNNIWWAKLGRLKSGHTKSCGCRISQVLKDRNITHNLSRHPLYAVFCSMKSRCSNETSEAYVNYGARGIKVCDEWLNDFTLFHEWAMSNGWSKGLEIDRKDNDKGYSPANCRISNDEVQSRNKRNNVIITAFGETKCKLDWSNDSRCKVHVETLTKRIKRGIDPELAMTATKISRSGCLIN